MKYSAGLHQDTKPSGSCSVKRMEMHLKGHLNIKSQTQISRSTDYFRTVNSAQSYGGGWERIMRDLGAVIVLVFSGFSLIPQWSHNSLTEDHNN